MCIQVHERRAYWRVQRAVRPEEADFGAELGEYLEAAVLMVWLLGLNRDGGEGGCDGFGDGGVE